ncbi:uncharacterized protein [Spinacia oleracea]|uniref:Secreted protein n=1 Tax=Spinacia oleracea TaxID=3562 RepID=A0ABM3QNE9_SPIOL|nr:uncharacterized protein LOC130461026 [Spinacia oleracea]
MFSLSAVLVLVSGGDPFAAFSMSKPGASPATSSAIVPVSFSPPASSMTTSSTIVAVASATQPSLRSNSLRFITEHLCEATCGWSTTSFQSICLYLKSVSLVFHLLSLH